MDEFIRSAILLIMIIVLVRVSASLGRRSGFPTLTIQLLVGILLGSSLVNLLGTPIILGTWGSISPDFPHSILKILSEIGLIQLMFLAGLHTDWQELKKMIKPIFSLSSWGFVLTTVCVAIITRLFVDRWAEALAISAIMGASSFGISTYNFSEVKFLRSRPAILVLGAAILSVLLAILLMIASLAMNYGTVFGMFRAAIAASWFLGKLVMFFAISYFLMSRFLSRIAKTNFQKRPRQMLIGYLLLVASLYAWGAMHFGSFAAVGIASMGGALLGMSHFGLKEKVREGLGSPWASLPVGVLFVVLGMEVNLKELGASTIFWVITFTTVVAAKWIGCWIGTREIEKLSNERFLVMLGALAPGEMGVLIAAYLFSRGLLNPSHFNISIIVVVMLTMITPALMKIVHESKIYSPERTKFSPSPFDGKGVG